MTLVLATVALCALQVQRTHQRLQRGRHRVDFQVFFRNAQVAAHGGDIYSTHRREQLYPYIYPPLLVSLLRPLTGLELISAVLFWNILQLLLIPLGFELLRRLLRDLGAPAPPLLAGGAVALCGWFFADNIVWAQVNIWVWLCVIGALLALRREMVLLAGALVALGASLKLLPVALLLLAPALGWRRAWRFLAAFGCGALLLGLALPGLVNGFGWAWRMNGELMGLLASTAGGDPSALPWGNNCANQSLLFAMQHWFGLCAPRDVRVDQGTISALYLGLRILLVVGTLATSALLGWRRDRGPWCLVVAQIMLLMLLANPITWVHHWVWISVALATVSAVALFDELGPRLRAVAAGLALVLGTSAAVGSQLETYRVGTLSLVHLGVWVGITALLLEEQVSGLRAGVGGG